MVKYRSHECDPTIMKSPIWQFSTNNPGMWTSAQQALGKGWVVD